MAKSLLDRMKTIQKRSNDLVKTLLFSSSLFFATPTTVANAADIYVPTQHSNIQAAVDSASDGDRVIIKDGTYTGEGNYNIHWGAVGKHLTIKSENGATSCVLDCNYKGRGFVLDSGQTNEDVIDGLTITKGYLIPVDDPASGDRTGGGGILIKSSSPIIRNCKLINNRTAMSPQLNRADGGAIEIIDHASPTISHNLIANNYASHSAGGINVIKYSSPIIEDNTITDNIAAGCYGGGGISLATNSSGRIRNNLITKNQARYYDKGGIGGGISIVNSNPFVVNNTLTDNSSIKNNHQGYSGGIDIGGLPYPILKNNIICNNRGPPGKENLVFYPVNSQNEILDLSYSLIGGGLRGTNVTQPQTIIDADPKLAADGYTLLPSSPCIDRGTTIEGLITDIDGNPRPRGNGYDIGCYESPYSYSAVKGWEGYE